MKIPNSVWYVCVGLTVLGPRGFAEAGGNAPACPVPQAGPVISSTFNDGYLYEEPRYVVDNPNYAAWAKDETIALCDTLDLTTAQTAKVKIILSEELAALYAPGKTAVKPIRQQAQAQIRALLTPGQRAKFNLIPQKEGGGLVGRTPWEQLDRLEKLVHLTASQKQPVLNELIDRTENLMENQAPEQTARRDEIRQVFDGEIRALLTPAQQKLLDAALAEHREKADLFAGS
jgi:Spy/CpxP family protein refolding chaperone